MLGTSMPKNLLVREIFGIILTLIYLTAIPPLFANQNGKEVIDNIGMIRYYVVIFSAWYDKSIYKDGSEVDNKLKYLVALPEWELNL